MRGKKILGLSDYGICYSVAVRIVGVWWSERDGFSEEGAWRGAEAQHWRSKEPRMVPWTAYPWGANEAIPPYIYAQQNILKHTRQQKKKIDWYRKYHFSVSDSYPRTTKNCRLLNWAWRLMGLCSDTVHLSVLIKPKKTDLMESCPHLEVAKQPVKTQRGHSS